MSDMRYIVRDTQTGEKFVWDLTQVLEEINRDRSPDWTPYTKDDWNQGWDNFVDNLEIIGFMRKSVADSIYS